MHFPGQPFADEDDSPAKSKYIVFDVNKGLYWTGKGWSPNRDDADKFGYEFFAREAAKGLNDGVGMRVEAY